VSPPLSNSLGQQVSGSYPDNHSVLHDSASRNLYLSGHNRQPVLSLCARRFVYGAPHLHQFRRDTNTRLGRLSGCVSVSLSLARWMVGGLSGLVTGIPVKWPGFRPEVRRILLLTAWCMTAPLDLPRILPISTAVCLLASCRNVSNSCSVQILRASCFGFILHAHSCSNPKLSKQLQSTQPPLSTANQSSSAETGSLDCDLRLFVLTYPVRQHCRRCHDVLCSRPLQL